MLRGRYRARSASRDQTPQTSSRDQAPKITSSHVLIYYRAVDLAKRYQVHVVTIWKWLRSGNLPPPTRLGPNTVAWRSDHIEAWESERREIVTDDGVRTQVARLSPKASP